MNLLAAGRQQAVLKCARGRIQHRQSTMPSNNFKPKSGSVSFKGRPSSAPRISRSGNGSLDGRNSGAENRVQIDAIDPKTPTTPPSAGSTQQGLHGVFSKSLRRHLKIRQAPRPDRLDKASRSGLANGESTGQAREQGKQVKDTLPAATQGHGPTQVSDGGNNP